MFRILLEVCFHHRLTINLLKRISAGMTMHLPVLLCIKRSPPVKQFLPQEKKKSSSRSQVKKCHPRGIGALQLMKEL